MTPPQLTGTVDWYNAGRGFGVIIGDNHQEYFVHVSTLPRGLALAPGQRLAFQARPRRDKTGLEVFQVVVVPAVKAPTPSAESGAPATPSRKPAPAVAPVAPPPPPARSANSAAATRAAAAEVLELQRLRKKGQAPPRVELFSPGTRVVHARHGTGTVVLAAPDIISVRFDSDPRVILDLPRREIGPTMVQPTGPTLQPTATAIRESAPLAHGQPAHDIAAVVRRLADDAKEALTRDGLDAGGIYHCDDATPSDAQRQSLSIDPRVAQAFANAQKIITFYSHQAETRELLLAGRHVVIATPTASGKTESYNPTILETLLADPAATALYVFPLVALGDDQTERLRRLNAELPADQQLKIGILNSDVSSEAKWSTRLDTNRIIVTTPEWLHYQLLPNSYANWRAFFRNLRYLVLDEAHVYKGFFGANMGHIVRRLLARVMREGNRAFPQVIISTATVHDPLQLAQQLTGLPLQDFAVVERSGAPRPRRHFLALPDDVHDVVDVASELLEATTIDARDHLRRPVRTIIFLRSISRVKRATEQLRDTLQRHGRHDLVEAVADYYADKADKQDVLMRLRRDSREGEVRCLFTTNALMAGIDIGSLDVAVVQNFPGLVMDAHQMFGRAGRAGEGAAIFLADRSDPFDQFYLERFDQLFANQTVEPVIANPNNPLLLASHLRCAAQMSALPSKNCEGPLTAEGARLFGSSGADMLDSLIRRDQLRVVRGTYHLPLGNPHQENPLDQLRSAEGKPYRLLDEGGQELEKKRRSYAYRDAHLDAVFWHNERHYKVIAFDDAARQIICQPTSDSDLRTQGVEEVTLTVIRELEPARELVPGIAVGFGEVVVADRVDEYVIYQSTKVLRCRNRTCRYESKNLELRRCPRCGGPLQARQVEKATGRQSVPQPPELVINLETQASWLAFSREVSDRFTAEFWPRWQTPTNGNGGMPARIEPEFGHAHHTVKHAFLKALPEQIRSDDGDISGLMAPAANEERLYVYDAFPGGLGYAAQVYAEPVELLEAALSRLEGCTCTEDDGCLVCLKYFRCRQFNDSLSKLAGRYLLRLALAQPVQPVLADLAEYVQDVVPRAQIVAWPARRAP